MYFYFAHVNTLAFDIDDHDFHTLDFMGSKWLPFLSLDIRTMLAFIALHDYCISCNMLLVVKDLGHWVKPKITTWYSNFRLVEYDDNRWREMFRMLKNALFNIARKLCPHLLKKKTKSID
jgi:hypothetical protein